MKINNAIKEDVIHMIQLSETIDPCHPIISYIADQFPGEYTTEREYVDFQMDIGELVEELAKEEQE